MNEPSKSDPLITKPPQIYWSSAYFVAVAVLYLWGFWSSFNINILEYVGLADVLKTAAYPIASVFIFMAIGAVLGDAVFPHGLLPPGGGVDTPIGRWLRKAAPALAAGYALVTTIYFVLDTPEKWRVMPVLIALPLSHALKELGLLQSVVRSDRALSVVLFLVAILPPFAYGHGTLKATEIINGRSFSFAASQLEGVSVDPKAPLESRPRYIGKAGGQYFFYMPTSQSTLIVPQAQIKVLDLKRPSQATKASSPPSAASGASANASGAKS